METIRGIWNCGKNQLSGKSTGRVYSSDDEDEDGSNPCISSPAQIKLEKECCNLQGRAAGLRVTADRLVTQAKAEMRQGRPEEQKRFLKMSMENRRKAQTLDTRAATIKSRLDSAESALSQASVASKLMQYDMHVKDKVARVAGNYNKLDHDGLQDAVTDVEDLEESITMGPGWKTELDVDAIDDADDSLEALIAQQNAEIVMSMQDLPVNTGGVQMTPPGAAGDTIDTLSSSEHDPRLARMMMP